MNIYSQDTDTQRYHGSNEKEMKKYCDDVRYSEIQLEIIRYGLECGFDVSIYANPEIPAEIMQEIFFYLKSEHSFIVRYLNTAGEKDASTVLASSKTEALKKFWQQTNNIKYILEVKDSK